MNMPKITMIKMNSVLMTMLSVMIVHITTHETIFRIMDII